MARKTYIVQAMDAAGGLLMDLRLDTRELESLAIREALEACQRNGGGWMRRQTVGARGWAVYACKPGDKLAPLMAPPSAAQINAKFEAWFATGGAAA